jgi:hypothetical protein
MTETGDFFRERKRENTGALTSRISFFQGGAGGGRREGESGWMGMAGPGTS